MSDKKRRVVFSTKTGDLRKQTETAIAPKVSLPPQQQNLKIMRERKGRKGKTVTVVIGFTLTEADLKTLAKTLKTVCGAGGTARNEADTQSIEIQGDHQEKVAEKLKTLGYKTKFVGG